MGIREGSQLQEADRLIFAGMSTMSSSLRDESAKYRKAARKINLDALYRKWAPVGVLMLMFLILVWWKFW